MKNYQKLSSIVKFTYKRFSPKSFLTICYITNIGFRKLKFLPIFIKKVTILC